MGSAIGESGVVGRATRRGRVVEGELGSGGCTAKAKQRAGRLLDTRCEVRTQGYEARSTLGRSSFSDTSKKDPTATIMALWGRAGCVPRFHWSRDAAHCLPCCAVHGPFTRSFKRQLAHEDEVDRFAAMRLEDP